MPRFLDFSPTSLLDTGDIAFQRMHPKHKLQQVSTSPHISRTAITYPTHLEIPQHTATLPTLDTSIPNLRASCITMHLSQLKLCLCADSRR